MVDWAIEDGPGNAGLCSIVENEGCCRIGVMCELPVIHCVIKHRASADFTLADGPAKNGLGWRFERVDLVGREVDRDIFISRDCRLGYGWRWKR